MTPARQISARHRVMAAGERRIYAAMTRRLTALADALGRGADIDAALQVFGDAVRADLYADMLDVGTQSGRLVFDIARRIERRGFLDTFLSAIRTTLSTIAAAKSVLITERQRRIVRAVLTRAEDDGAGEDETQRAMRDKVRQLTPMQAARIARTEAHSAAESAAHIAARDTGLELIKEWVAVGDMRTRPAHAATHGQRRALNQPFNVGVADGALLAGLGIGEQLMYPGDPSGSAKNVINCRCGVAYRPVVNGEVL